MGWCEVEENDEDGKKGSNACERGELRLVMGCRSRRFQLRLVGFELRLCFEEEACIHLKTSC